MHVPLLLVHDGRPYSVLIMPHFHCGECREYFGSHSPHINLHWSHSRIALFCILLRSRDIVGIIILNIFPVNFNVKTIFFSFEYYIAIKICKKKMIVKIVKYFFFADFDQNTEFT